MNIKQQERWLKYARRFKLKSLEEVEAMEEILKMNYDHRKFYIQDIGKNEYWTVKEESKK